MDITNLSLLDIALIVAIILAVVYAFKIIKTGVKLAVIVVLAFIAIMFIL